VRVSLVVAAARNGVIGAKGEIPWRLPDDQRFFRRLTLGHPIVMGRKTWESIGRPLPGRENLVLTRRTGPAPDGTERFADLSRALAACKAKGAAECFVIGGEAVYREALATADRVYLTRVEAEPEGDVFFPDLDPETWKCTASERHERDERHAHAFAIETWERRC